MSADYHQDRLIFFTSSWKPSQSAPSATVAATRTSYDFLAFLEIVQRLNIPFLPVTWQVDQGKVGQGGTAGIYQSLVDSNTSFAFKRLASVGSALSEVKKTGIFEALIAEISVLGHDSVRRHPHIIMLEGICWDIQPSEEMVWPVLVFEKSQHGDLQTFMEQGAGTTLGLSTRLRICLDVATAVSDLHLNGIIHGDIKPANVLVFETDRNRHVAKVVDFGYSTLLAGADDLILMPRSPPWTAPEWHHRPIYNANAVKMDVYSLGMLCLWLLFYNSEQETHRNFYEDMKVEESTSVLAHQLATRMTSVNDQQRSHLYQLFDLSLASDPAKRSSDIRELVSLLIPLVFERHDVFTAGGMQDSHIIAPFERDLQMLPQNFRVAPSIFKLYEAHYRVRIYIATCLEERVLNSSTSASQHAAFELSFCYKLGFGVNKDDDKSVSLLKQAGRSEEDLMCEIDRIRYGTKRRAPRQGVYNESLYSGRIQLTTGGRLYLEQELLDETGSRLRKEIADVEIVLGVDHQILEALKSNLTGILTSQNRWEEAQELQIEVMRSSSRALGGRHPDTLTAMTTLAFIHQGRKQWKEAEELQTQVMNTSLSALGPNHIGTLSNMGNLAVTYQRQGKLKKAEQLAKQVLDARKRVFGPENPYTLRSLDLWTSICEEQEGWKRSEEWAVQSENSTTDLILPQESSLFKTEEHCKGKEAYILQIMELKEEELGREHPLVLNHMMLLLVLYKRQGRWTEAERIALEVVEIRKRKHPDHPLTTTAMIQLGSIYGHQGRLKEAEELQRQIIDSSSFAGGSGPGRSIILGHLALTYQKQGRYSDAEILQTQVVEANKACLGQEHPITMSSLLSLSSTYIKQARWSEAEELVLHVVDFRQKRLGQNHPSTLASMNDLAIVFQRQGRLNEAEELGQQVLDMKKKVSGDRHPNTLRAMRDLALTWNAQKRHEEAIALLSDYVALSETIDGFNHHQIRNSKQTLDQWIAESNHHQPARDNKKRETPYNSDNTASRIHEELNKTLEASLDSTPNVDCLANHNPNPGTRNSESVGTSGLPSPLTRIVSIGDTEDGNRGNQDKRQRKRDGVAPGGNERTLRRRI